MTKQDKVAKVMHEWKNGRLTSNGKKVTDYDQAIAIALSEAGLSKYAEGGGVGNDKSKVKLAVKNKIKKLAARIMEIHYLNLGDEDDIYSYSGDLSFKERRKLFEEDRKLSEELTEITDNLSKSQCESIDSENFQALNTGGDFGYEDEDEYEKGGDMNEYSKGGNVIERRYVNKDEDYETRYAKDKPSRMGYKDERKFAVGGEITEKGWKNINDTLWEKGEIMVIDESKFGGEKVFSVENNLTQDVREFEDKKEAYKYAIEKSSMPSGTKLLYLYKLGYKKEAYEIRKASENSENSTFESFKRVMDKVVDSKNEIYSRNKFAVGGEIGNTVSFKGDYGTPRSGVVKEKRGSSYIVSTDDGDRLVDSYEVISFSETPVAKKKRFGFFAGGGSIESKKQAILDFINSFPDKPKDWSEATDDLPELHYDIADEYGSKYDFDFNKRSSLRDRNLRHKQHAKSLLNKLSDEEIDKIYSKWEETLEDKFEGGGKIGANDSEIAEYYGENYSKLKKYQIDNLRSEYQKDVVEPLKKEIENNKITQEKEMKNKFSKEYDFLNKTMSADEISEEYDLDERDGRSDSEMKKDYIDWKYSVYPNKYAGGGSVESSMSILKEETNQYSINKYGEPIDEDTFMVSGIKKDGENVAFRFIVAETVSGKDIKLTPSQLFDVYRDEKYAEGGEIQSKIDKLQAVVNSKMLPEGVKEKAQAEIDKLEKQLHADSVLKKSETYHEEGKDVYGDSFYQWHNISFEGDEDIFAYSTPKGTVIYGEDSEGEKDFNTSFTTEPYYLEESSEEDYSFNTLKESKVKAFELLKTKKLGIASKELHESKETKAEEKEEHKKGGSEYKSKLEKDLEKELHSLQRDLNSSRLQTYIEGDNSEEEKARQRERTSKIIRMNEVLSLLNEIEIGKENKMTGESEGERKVGMDDEKDYIEAKTKALEKSLKDKTISETQRKRDEKELALFKKATATTKKPTTRKAPVKKAVAKKVVVKKEVKGDLPKSKFEKGDKVGVSGDNEVYEIKDKSYRNNIEGELTWVYYLPEYSSVLVSEKNLKVVPKPKADHKKLVAKLKAKKGQGNNDRGDLVNYKDGSTERRKRSESSDKKREALPLGKRVSADGNTYYERRLNRADISKGDKFEKGGEVTGSGWGLNLNW
jgi:hypothetical protein